MKHLVLVHGAGHGAWSWYKVVTLLRSAGHRVTAVDLGGSTGINPKRMDEMGSIFDYLQPLTELMASVPKEERVILVAHSLGGFAASLAMEQFPEKISVAVFLTALMPNHTSSPASLLKEFFRRTPLDSVLDCEFSFKGAEKLPTSVILGSDYLAINMYQNCPPEDLTLATMLVRPASYFVEDLSKETLITKEKFGSVNRFYIICDQDKTVKEDFQRWMIENNPTEEVKVITGADHMVMLSKPQELCLCLKEIAAKYD